MVKCKAEECWTEEPEVDVVSTEVASAKVATECGSTAGVTGMPDTGVPIGLMATQAGPTVNEVAKHEVPIIEVFWQILARAGYECW